MGFVKLRPVFIQISAVRGLGPYSAHQYVAADWKSDQTLEEVVSAEFARFRDFHAEELGHDVAHTITVRT